MEQKKYFDILQIYRGIAALLVVIHHTYASFAHFNNLDIPTIAFIAKVGKLGVDFSSFYQVLSLHIQLSNIRKMEAISKNIFLIEL